MPPDLLAANLQAIDERFLHGTSAGDALDLLASPPKDLDFSTLLRSHLLESVTSAEEVGRRDAVDDLLTYSGVLEIGAMVGAIPWPLPSHLAEPLQVALSRPEVRRYYEHFYPLILPTLFRWRLEKAPLIPFGAQEKGLPHFMQSLVLWDALEDGPVSTFLAFLDDFHAWDPDQKDYVSLGDLLSLLTRPEAVIEAFPRPRHSPVHEALTGFVRFLAFTENLDRLLVEASKTPMLQSALWHQHAYWYLQLSGQVGGVMATAIEQFREYVATEDMADDPAIQHTHELMNRSQLVLQRMTSSLYRAPLEAAFFRRTLGAKQDLLDLIFGQADDLRQQGLMPEPEQRYIDPDIGGHTGA